MQDVIVQALWKALELIFSGNNEVYATVYRSLYVTGLGTLLSCLWSIPIATVLGLYSFRGKWLIKSIFNSLIGIPTVALGLLLYLFMSHQGEFGFLHLLYTLNGIAIGQSILITPLIVSFTASALGAADVQLRDLAKTLGASSLRCNLAIMRETVWSMVLAVSAAFNRGFGELGVAMIDRRKFVSRNESADNFHCIGNKSRKFRRRDGICNNPHGSSTHDNLGDQPCGKTETRGSALEEVVDLVAPWRRLRLGED